MNLDSYDIGGAAIAAWRVAESHQMEAGAWLVWAAGRDADSQSFAMERALAEAAESRAARLEFSALHDESKALAS